MKDSTKCIYLLTVLLLWPLAAAAETFCYQVYQATRFNCYEYNDPIYGYMGRCDSYNVYDVECWYQAEEPILIEPPFIGREVPAVIDPAFLYILKIDDSEPENIVVVASAVSYLDQFALEYNGRPYGTAWGSGEVRISGVPARELGQSGQFWVQACHYLAGCAAAEASTWTSPAQKHESGSVTAVYLDAGAVARAKIYDHNVTIDYDVRGYGVAWGPGNSRNTFKEGRSSFSYDYQRDKPTFRSEELQWRVDPGMYLADSCDMTEIPVQVLEKPGMTTSMQGCSMGGVIGYSGMFAGSISGIFEQTFAGMDIAAYIMNSDLTVTVP